MNVPLTALREHPLNSKIYFTSEEDDAELERSIAEHGIRHPIQVNTEGLILSGHRRFKAAVKLGLHEVPVEYKKFKDQDEELQYLIISNMYRSKSMEEKVREGQQLKDILARRGEKSRDSVGKHLGMSGRTYDKAEHVVETIDAIKDTDPERAQHLRERLNKSVDGAYKETLEDDDTITIDGKAELQESIEEESRRRLYFYEDDVMKVATIMDAVYNRLSKQRGPTTPESVGHMIGNICEMKERLLSWHPSRMQPCTHCEGTGQIKTPGANGAETVVSCPVCVAGKVGLYKASKK